MKNFLLPALLSLFAISASAQFSTDPANPADSVTADNGLHEIYFDIMSTDTMVRNVLWEFSLSAETPDDWEVRFCDDHGCYTEAFPACPASNPNVLQPATPTDWKVQLVPDTWEGEGTFILDIMYAEEPHAVVYTVNVSLKAGHPVGLGAPVLTHDISIFPAPAKDVLTVDLGAQVSAQLQLFDVNGRLALTQRHDTDQLAQLDVAALPAGVYVLQIQTGHTTESRKVVIQ